jgi:hypothetical protein
VIARMRRHRGKPPIRCGPSTVACNLRRPGALYKPRTA